MDRRRHRPFVLALVLQTAPGIRRANAAFPGANGKIVFTAMVGQDRQVFTVNPDGSGLTQLTTGPGWNLYPKWSPDGTKIVFERRVERKRGVPGQVAVMNAAGSGLTVLASTRADTYPAWSPDGKRIVFVSNLVKPRDVSRAPIGEANRQLWTMHPDGTNRRQITEDSDKHREPAWSPDGTKIVFEHGTYTNDFSSGDIWVMAADGSNPTRVTSLGTAESPDRQPATP